ncbi:ABC-F family ATP-binding cassette domain-containing protein [Dehalobacter sp. DCM]|uniref:ABC-F family ATP-binding cassette domain-containing protein n=1 Tax=Dehalobacter sp. DCM TaxID=2907827 RepID=UPI003FCCFC81
MDIEVAGSPLLKDISFRLEKGMKAGLVGANGAGKTTLLRALLGEIGKEKGDIHWEGTVGYLPQTPEAFAEEGTVFDLMLMERQDILEMRNNLRYLEISMANNAEEKILHQYGRLTERYEREGGYALEARVRKILFGLGLEEQQNKSAAHLSGGQKTRLALGKLLLRDPDTLIMDEPTNHLDIEALEWLEGYLTEYAGAVLIVSHDRYFIDKIVDRIFLIEEGNLKSYEGNYSEFELQRQVEKITLTREAERVNKKIADLEAYILRHGAGIKAKQARGRESMLKRITPVTAPKTTKTLTINFHTKERSGNVVLTVDDLAVKYTQKPVFEHVNLELRRGDKVAVLGRNGAGKTTLLKTIMGQIPYSGTLKIGANVSVSYYSQEHEDVGQRESVIDEIRYACQLDDPEIRSILARFGFRSEDVFKPVSGLSGGEKSRLALCKLFLNQGNLLLLDEPTNHLDMETREVLEEVLREYNGTILTVSHDRYFLDRIANKIACLTREGLRIYEGDYTYYREMIERENANKAPGIGNLSDSKKNASDPKENHDARIFREESKQAKRMEKKIKQIEERIDETEIVLKELESKLHAAASDYELTLCLHQEYESARLELDALMEEWMAYQE